MRARFPSSTPLAPWMLASCIAFAAGASAGETAAPPQPQAIEILDASHFDSYAPANALDMVQRLPGFTIVAADEDVRGYAGALGNVLIDGARPGSKRDDIQALLRRIPAASVLRVELIRDGSAGYNLAGHAQLANVVRLPSAVSEMAVEAGLVAATEGWLTPSGQFEYGRHFNDRALELSVTVAPELDDDSGRGRIVSASPEGRVLKVFGQRNRTVDRLGDATASWRQPLAGGSLALHSAVRGERASAQIRLEDSIGGQVEAVDETEDYDEAEIGARFVRGVGERSTLEVMAGQQLSWLDAQSRARSDGGEERFEERTRTGEGIGSIAMTHEHSTRLSLNTGLEAALNFLQGDARLFEDGVAVALPGSDIRIEERRLEASLGTSWRPSDALSFESNLRIEHSRLDQTGDSPLQRSFVYYKPRVSAAWERDESRQLRVSLSREVGQLDFDDFVASASLTTGVVTAGNAQLQPDKTLRAMVSWERKFLQDGAWVATWTHDRISDVIDLVPVVAGDEVFDAPGNIGDGRRDSLALEAGSSLQAAGLPNLHLSAAVLWQRSRVTDPTTGKRRPISEEVPLEGSFALAHALPGRGLSWGLEMALAMKEVKYGIDEVSTEREAASWTLFAEQRLERDWRLRAELTDLGGRRFSEHRVKYDGLRSQVPVEELERRSRRYPGQLLITLRRNMGG